MQSFQIERMHNLEDRYWWFIARRNTVVDFARRHLPAGKPILLDIGAGGGANGFALIQDARVISLDISLRSLELCKKRGLQCPTLASAEVLPFKNESVDMVVALDILEHLEDDNRALAECLRVLKPGGRLLLTVPAYQFLWSLHDQALYHRRRYRRRELRMQIRQAGFLPLYSGYFFFFLFPLALLQRLLTKWVFKPAEIDEQIPRIPSFLNALLVRFQKMETALMHLAALPFGLSILAVAEKPGGPAR